MQNLLFENKLKECFHFFLKTVCVYKDLNPDKINDHLVYNSEGITPKTPLVMLR
jgi:hypothetical protein